MLRLCCGLSCSSACWIEEPCFHLPFLGRAWEKEAAKEAEDATNL